MNKLHILNGDSTLFQFEKTTIEGDKFVWREILCEGQITSNIGTELFWEQREKYLANFLNDDISYAEKFKNPFIELNVNKYNEITLWFEYDLFCQINLIAVLSWLNNQKIENCKLSLICLGEHKNYNKLVGLGEINFEEYHKLYEQRIELTKSDLKFGSTLWNLYISKEHDVLLDKIKYENNHKFKYLLPAIKVHLKRFPNKENGLNEIEYNIAKSIKSNFKLRKQVIEELLNNESYYGFGDSQYINQIEDLKPILTEKNDRLKLNKLGESILNSETDFMKYRIRKIKYGGSNLEDFRWDSKKGKLIKFKTGY